MTLKYAIILKIKLVGYELGFCFFFKGKVKEKFNSSHLKAIKKNNIFSLLQYFEMSLLLRKIFLPNCPPSWINFYTLTRFW